MEHLGNIVEQERETMQSRGQPCQPFIAIIDKLEEINAVFVIIDTVRYEIRSVLRAIDLLFKIFQVFDTRYPTQCEHLWILIQQCIYRIKTEHDKIIPYIMDIIRLFSDNSNA